MSDSRRRRKSQVSRGSDDLSDSYDELNTTKETQSSEHTEDQHDSEYDTAGTDSNSESQDGAQRESGDGQEEEKPTKKLDDDEDRRNPQYIPKRGTFYEHDDRTAEETEDNATETPPERESKEKKVWKDKEDRWNHDRYNDEEQAPKSHEELIAVYGYDIRNEEGPPRARRRRRYGRGPNKYTRNWEDENAYGKMGGSTTSKGSRRVVNRTGEEFPALNTRNKDTSAKVEEPVITSAWYNNKNKPQAKSQNFPPLQNQKENEKSKPVKTTTNQQNEVISDQNNVQRKKEVKMPTQAESQKGNGNGNTSLAGNSLANQEKIVSNTKSVPRENKRYSQENQTRSRGRGFKANQNNNIINKVSPTENKMKGRGTVPNVVENKRANPQNMVEQLVHEMKQVHVSDNSYLHGRQNKHFYTQSSSQQRTNSGPSPRLQQSHQQPQIHPQPSQPQQPQQQQPDASGNRPKRYSSLRQRPPITESPAQQNYQPQPQQHGYYTTQGYPPSHYEQAPPVAPAAGPMNSQPVLPMPPPGAQPTGYAPPPFLVPPPQFIPPQTAPPSLINYVPTPNGPAFQNYQGYQGYNPPVQVHEQVDYIQQGPPPPPQELFQPQGCTYYSPAQQQQQQQQSAPMRRPKIAIPILPPPENPQNSQAGKGRGRTGTPQQIVNQQRPGIHAQSESLPQLEEKKPSIEIPQEAVPPGKTVGLESETEQTEKVVSDVHYESTTVLLSPTNKKELVIEQICEPAAKVDTNYTEKEVTVPIINEDSVIKNETECAVAHKNPVVEEAAA